MSEAVFGNWVAAMRSCTVDATLRHAKYSIRRATEKRRAKTLGEEAQYVNVIGGARLSKEVQDTAKWLRASGFERYVDVVDGPARAAGTGASLGLR